MIICGQKINFILHILLEILERYCKFVIFVTLGMPGFAHPKQYYQLAENICIYLQAKKQFHHVFLEILKRYANFLFWILNGVILQLPAVF